MNNPASQHGLRILAIDPTTHGFGYVVLEEPDRLVNWGVKEARANKNTKCLKQIKGVMERNDPDLVIVEDWRKTGSRRQERVRELIDGIIDLAREKKIQSQSVSRMQIKSHFKKLGVFNKDEIAQFLAKQFPDLERRLPPERKAWMSEDKRLAIFDALALIMAWQARPERDGD